jgi:adenylate cyclase
MQQAVAALNPTLPRRIDIHVGVHSGVVALANIGSAEYLQVATIGDATNTAARVCSVAAEGEIVITRDTADRLRHPERFPLVALPPAQVKGKRDPLVLYRVERR